MIKNPCRATLAAVCLLLPLPATQAVATPSISSDLPVADVSVSSSGPPFPQIASNGLETLVVWQTGVEIWGAIHHGPFGSIPDPVDPAFPIYRVDPAYQFAKIYSPRVSSSGTRFLVLWAEQGSGSSDFDLRGVRLDSDGTPLDSLPFTISDLQGDDREPAIAADDTGWMVVFRVDYGVPRARHVSRGGSLGAINRVYDKNTGAENPAISWNGSSYLVAWTGGGSGFDCRICGRLLDDSGSPQGKIILIDNTKFAEIPVIASNGDDWIVAWSLGQFPSAEIQAARVGNAGKVLDKTPFPVAAPTGNRARPAVSWDATAYLIAWMTDHLPGEPSEIRARRLSSQGGATPADGAGFLVAALENAEGLPAVAAVGPGRTLIASEDYLSGSPLNPYRISLRLAENCDLAGGPCPPALLEPLDGSTFPAGGPSPAFWWEPGSFTDFHLEFSAAPDFSGPIVSEKKPFRPTISFTPDKKLWKKVKAIAPAGENIYWRLTWLDAGVTVAGPTRAFTLVP